MTLQEFRDILMHIHCRFDNLEVDDLDIYSILHYDRSGTVELLSRNPEFNDNLTWIMDNVHSRGR